MDTKTYIESGIIESYVLGLADSTEVSELEMLCAQYPDIKQALDDFERQIENHAFSGEVTPPADLKHKLMLALADEFEPEAENNNAKNRLTAIPGFDTADTDTIKLQGNSFWKYMAAASVILLVASGVFNYVQYNKLQSATTKYEALLTERNSLQASNGIFETRLNDFQKSVAIMENPDVLKVDLPGIKGKENNHATVYWDNKTKDVYFLSAKMDKIPEDKQYQLWAIVDGKPVNAGLITDCDGLCKLENIPRAELFAVTLEPKGGSKSPTLSDMYVAGAVLKQS